jgi:hypothetical protein
MIDSLEAGHFKNYLLLQMFPSVINKESRSGPKGYLLLFYLPSLTFHYEFFKVHRQYIAQLLTDFRGLQANGQLETRMHTTSWDYLTCTCHRFTVKALSKPSDVSNPRFSDAGTTRRSSCGHRPTTHAPMAFSQHHRVLCVDSTSALDDSATTQISQRSASNSYDIIEPAQSHEPCIAAAMRGSVI